MAVSNPYIKYQQNEITTAGPDELLLIAYDAAIRFAKIGRERMKTGANIEKSRSIGKSRALIAELMSALDPKPSPQLAANLSSLYLYMHNRLVEADLDDNEKALTEVIDMLTDLRAAWGQAALTWRGQPTERRLAA